MWGAAAPAGDLRGCRSSTAAGTRRGGPRLVPPGDAVGAEVRSARCRSPDGAVRRQLCWWQLKSIGQRGAFGCSRGKVVSSGHRFPSDCSSFHLQLRRKMSVNVRNTPGFMLGFKLGDPRLSYLGLFNPSMIKTQCRRGLQPLGHSIITLKRSRGQQIDVRL